MHAGNRYRASPLDDAWLIGSLCKHMSCYKVCYSIFWRLIIFASSKNMKTRKSLIYQRCAWSVMVTKAAIIVQFCGLNVSPAMDFAQITSSKLDAGEQTFEAFRVLRDGRIESAIWNTSGRLLRYSESQNLKPDYFNNIVSLKKLYKSYKSPSLWGNKIGPRQVFSLEISTNIGGEISITESQYFPDSVLTFTDDLRRRMESVKVQSGWYVWTKPYNAPMEKADIDLTKVKTDSAVVAALLVAINTGKLIVKADDSIQTFVSGENAYRSVFVAKLAKGQMTFGVLLSD